MALKKLKIQIQNIWIDSRIDSTLNRFDIESGKHWCLHHHYCQSSPIFYEKKVDKQYLFAIPVKYCWISTNYRHVFIQNPYIPVTQSCQHKDLLFFLVHFLFGKKSVRLKDAPIPLKEINWQCTNVNQSLNHVTYCSSRRYIANN